MNRIWKRIVASMMAGALALGCAACGGDAEEQTAAGGRKLTYWVKLNPNAAMSVSDYGETPFAKELEKKFQVDIEYQHPPQGQEAEKFNIMISMGELPDIIEYTWMSYPGGPAKALADGVIQELNLKEKAPNLYAYAQANPDVDKLMKTDDGKYFAFPFIRGDRSLQTSAGLIVRKDWLDEINMEVPQTIDEWGQMLRAFRDQKGAKYPISYAFSSASWGAFVGAYGTVDGLYLDDGTVKYGALEPGYKEFLTKLNEWYQEGLIASDFSTMDSKTLDSNIINGFSGAASGSVGSGLGRWMSAATDPKFQLVAAPYPVLQAGEKPQFGQMQLRTPGRYTALSRDCSDVDLAMQILDYGYGQEGQMFYNFGIEGESYEMKDGYPTYTQVITANPDGLSMTAAMARYIQAYDEGPFIQDKRYMDQYASLPEQKEAIQIWSDTDMESHLLPNISLLPEESEVMAKKINAVDTYKNEMVTKFIMGLEPISGYDAFVSELENRGIGEYLQLMQQAYERYLNR